MNTPIIVDTTEPKWLLLGQVIEITTSRVVKQAMARRGVLPVGKAGAIIRILFLSMFFSTDISYVVKELEKRSSLRSFIHSSEIPSLSTIYQFISSFSEEQFIFFISDILNSMCKKSNRRRNRTIIIDGSAITLDLNSFRRKFRKIDLLKKDYRWGFSNTHGYYLGFKLSLIIDYPSLIPLSVLIHPGSPNDSKLFIEILEELKSRRIIQNGDKLIFDKGYFSARNYQLGILKYKIVPIIFPRKNFKIEKAYSRICYPLSVFSRHDGKKVMKEFKILLARFKNELLRWIDYILTSQYLSA